MTIRHATSGEVISVHPLGSPLDDSQSTTLPADRQPTLMPHLETFKPHGAAK